MVPSRNVRRENNPITRCQKTANRQIAQYFKSKAAVFYIKHIQNTPPLTLLALISINEMFNNHLVYHGRYW